MEWKWMEDGSRETIEMDWNKNGCKRFSSILLRIGGEWTGWKLMENLIMCFDNINHNSFSFNF